MSQTRSASIREQLDHPVIDSDGHIVEYLAPMEDYVKAIGGGDYEVSFFDGLRFGGESDAARAERGIPRPPWWGLPAENTRDRATAALPKLLHERMDELGLDYTLLFTTMIGVGIGRRGSSPAEAARDPEVRRIRNRAANAYRMDICREYADRLTPAADVSMLTPETALDDLEHAVCELGHKAISIMAVPRPIPALLRAHPELFEGPAYMSYVGMALDTFGIDSPYDYDPFWRRCEELGVPIFCHGPGMGFTARSSPSNYMYNHIGHFADAGEAVCKSLFFGGVTRRFPGLRFGFLEGGVAWGCRLYGDLVGRYEKRGGHATRRLDPRMLDRELFAELHARYGDEPIQARIERVLEVGGGILPERIEDETALDDFRACGIEGAEDIRERFIPNFYFGCEADDPSNAMAFQDLWPFGARPRAIFSSDIGHWDVPDMREVLEEAWELVERGALGESDFREFTFCNPVELLAGANPDFFRGTAIEAEVDKYLGGPR